METGQEVSLPLGPLQVQQEGDTPENTLRAVPGPLGRIVLKAQNNLKLLSP